MAFETMVTSNAESTIVDSLKILKTLIANATTKGQLAGQDNFRTVRLENAKIKAAVADIVGAMDVLLECGFQLTQEEDDGAAFASREKVSWSIRSVRPYRVGLSPFCVKSNNMFITHHCKYISITHRGPNIGPIPSSSFLDGLELK
jgi:PUB domain